MIPLYIGTEIILSFAILNKAGGAYGVLSILTGHHMNFWQWLYNLLAFVTLPFYISALFNLLNRGTNVRKTCLGCLIYILDTFVGLLYTVYFVYFWFSREDSRPGSYGGNQQKTQNEVSEYTARDVTHSQSASPSRELFLTVSGTIITSALRLYFCLVFLLFTRQLLKLSQLNQRNHGTDSVGEEVLHPTSIVGRVRRFVYDLEMRAKLYFTDMFA